MIAAVLSILTMAVTNAPAFLALGVDVADMFTKGTALVSSDVASTPEERAAALATIEGLQAQFDARMVELKQTAPNS
jgi:hypothetical protein